MTTPIQSVASPRLLPRPLRLVGQQHYDTRARRSERMAKHDRPAIDIHLGRIVGEVEHAQIGERLARKGFVELDRVEVREPEPEGKLVTACRLSSAALGRLPRESQAQLPIPR